jgi:hypothetical protein
MAKSRNMKKLIVPAIILIGLSSCTNSCSRTKSSPEGLAKECCDCYQEMKSIQNDSKRANKLDECMRLTTINLSKLRQLGIDNDWNNEQVKDAEKRFDAIYDKCDN